MKTTSKKLTTHVERKVYSILVSNLYNVIHACEKLGLDIDKITIKDLYNKCFKKLYKLTYK